jgi:hypothetical protein
MNPPKFRLAPCLFVNCCDIAHVCFATVVSPFSGSAGNSVDADEYKRISEELQSFGTALMNQSRSGALYVEVNGSKVEVDADRIQTTNNVICPEGSVPSDDGKLCGKLQPHLRNRK